MSGVWYECWCGVWRKVPNHDQTGCYTDTGILVEIVELTDSKLSNISIPGSYLPVFILYVMTVTCFLKVIRMKS